IVPLLLVATAIEGKAACTCPVTKCGLPIFRPPLPSSLRRTTLRRLLRVFLSRFPNTTYTSLFFGSTVTWFTPPRNAFTVANLGVGCVLWPVATCTPVELPFNFQVFPPSVERFRIQLMVFGSAVILLQF